MSVSEPFIRRPIATSLLGIALLIGGGLGYWALPVSALPQVDFPTVQVTTQLPGASPDVIASLITAPLERQLGQIPSLSSMTSTSSFGVSQISLQFDLNRDIDGATQDVQAAINAAAGVLPKTLPYPPTYAKVNPADAPVLTLALTSETISLRAMSDLADTILGQRLSQISGVGRVAVLGGLKPAVRVQADLARLAAYGIAMEDLRNAIAGANVSGPKGSLDGAQQAYTIAANDQIASADAYKPIIIAYRNGAPVTIGDVAVIVDGLENDRTGGWYQGTPAVIIDIQRQPGANVIEVVRQIRAEMPKLQRAIPAGVNLTVVSDRTVTIRASVHDVQFTLILSVVLVTLVVLLFLRSLRATLIAGVALPLSLITSFGIMYFSGFSLDNLSLMALTIGTGFVVDDAIVMIENIVRHMENGETAMQASLRGASEIGFTVISLTVSLIAVFIPLLFMSGLVGRMFREFALTLTIAVVTSAIVSLTLTPMMCSRLLKHAGEEMAVPGLAAVSRFIDRMVDFYHRTLLWVLQHQRATLVVTFATLAATLILYVVAPKGFLPLQDTASITAVTEAGADVSFAEMQSRQTQAADAIKADPDVTGVVSVIGAGSVNPTTNVGRLVMTLKPRGERRDDVSVVVARLKQLTASIPGLTIYFQRDTDPYLRIFPFFLLLTAIEGLIENYQASHHLNNTALTNLFSVVTFCFYFFVLYRIIRNLTARKIILYILYIYPCIALINIFFIQKIDVFHSITFSLGCLLIVAICIYYFFELFRLPHSVNLLRQPPFWICSGLLFFFTCIFPVYGFNSLIANLATVVTIKNLVFLVALLNVFLYSSFTIAFLCRLRTRKSM